MPFVYYQKVTIGWVRSYDEVPPLLRIEHLSHHYPEPKVETLRRISFSVEPGSVCALVGASGSGKTTLLRLIGGQLDSTEGAVWLSGNEVKGPSYRLVPGHPDIRTVFQDFALSPNLSVYQNIAHVLRAYRRDYREERTTELIRRFHLAGREEQRPATLSGGEKQRLAIARALAEEPVLLLMDEPFSQVDPPLKRRLLREIVAILRETAGTALFVTHDAPDALALADQIVVLRQGALVQQGTPQQVYEHPVSPYVAQLMGECSVVDVDTFRRWYPTFVAEDFTHVGIRPEHVRIADQAGEIAGQVIRSRYRGGYYEIVITSEGTELTAYSRQTIAEGTQVACSVASDKVVLFKMEEQGAL